MSEMVWYQAYRDEFAGDNYPLIDDATLTSVGSLLVLSPGLFIDAAIYPVGGSAGARIAQIQVVVGSVTFILGDSISPFTASTTFNPRAVPAVLDLVDPFGRPAGLIVTNPTALTIAQTWPVGVYTFLAGSTDFVARCCFPTPYPGVRSLAIAGAIAVGDVWLIGDTGVVLSSNGSEGIIVDIVGDPLSSRLACQSADLFTTPKFVTSLAVSDGTHSPIVLTPDANGDVQIVVGNSTALDTTLRLVPTGVAALKLSVVGPALTN